MAWFNPSLLFFMNKLFEIRKLTEDFYKDYPKERYPEIEQKSGRPYIVLLMKIDDNTFAIPLRTNIRHRYCYKFKKTGRSTNSATGIDYSKAVLILKETYLGTETDIDDKEYLEIQNKGYFIIKQFKKYVYGYIAYLKYGGNQYIEKKYRYSTLKYYDDVLLSNDK